jgi:hypothetical protein
MSTRQILIALAMLMVIAAPVAAQEPDVAGAQYELPPGWITAATPGMVPEPSILSKLALSTEATIGREPSDGFYVETGKMITGSGWLSAGPGYRRTVLDGRGRLDLSAAVSWKLYKLAQASFELPHLLRDRLSIGI